MSSQPTTTRLHLVGKRALEVHESPLELIERFLGREQSVFDLQLVDGRTASIVPNDIVQMERL